MRPKARMAMASAAIALVASCNSGVPSGPESPQTPDRNAKKVDGSFESPSPSPTSSPRPKQTPPPINAPKAIYPYPTPFLPEAGPREIVGQVLSQGRPIAGITVRAVHNISYRNYVLTTDAQGLFRASNVEPGPYFVHYYNDSDNNKIGFFKTLIRRVSEDYGATFPAFDVYLVGMKNDPPMGSRTTLPAEFRWETYPLAHYQRFRVHDRGGPGGKPYYISDRLPPDQNTLSYGGAINQSSMGSGTLGPGRYLWGLYWDCGEIGEGGNLYQDIVFTEPTEEATSSP